MSNTMKSAPMDPEIADRLLDLLSTEGDFRDLFQNDPRAALESIGYQSPMSATLTTSLTASDAAAEPEALISCRVQSLASPDAIAAARVEIRTMLLAGLGQTTPQLDASLGDGTPVLK